MGFSAIFGFMADRNPEFVESVVKGCLGFRGKASGEAKQALDVAVNQAVTARDVPQFPNKPALAPDFMLMKPVLFNVLRSDRLAGAALRVWAESRESLRAVVVERLGEIGMAAEGPDVSSDGFSGVWDGEAWLEEAERLAESSEDADLDEAGLMLCWASGLMPVSGSASGVLLEGLEYLRGLEADAPEWESEVPEFVEAVNRLRTEKAEEASRRAADFEALAGEVAGEFSDELAYLEADLGDWRAARIGSGPETGEALRMAGELRVALEEYRSVYERAAVRSEEMARAERRAELEGEILEMVEGVGGMLSDEVEVEDAGSEAEAAEGDGADEAARVDYEALESERDALKLESEALRTERDGLKSRNEALESERDGLRMENEHLRSDMEDAKSEGDSLRNRLNESREEVGYWRGMYEDERQKPKVTTEEAPSQVESVEEAVSLAGELFEGRLLVNPNSKSEVEGNPFEKPAEVWDALEWLATTYYDSRAGEASVPDFDQSIREACGWWYKSDQHETTHNKYRDWYTTRVNGKRRWVLEHIGTGSGRDARHTIRIAFDWDRDERVVVVGYIGQHQRTDAS